MIKGVYNSIEAYNDHPDQISYKRVLSIINNEDPYISADYHLFKDKVIVDDASKEKKEMKRNDKIISWHNGTITDKDYFLFLGDLTESELKDGEDLIELKDIVNKLHGKKKILICGNNDIQNWEYYLKLGFDFVTRSPIVTSKFIFSHEPIDVCSMPIKEDEEFICIHGHIHQWNVYYNMDYKKHINCYWEATRKPLRLSEWLEKYNTNQLDKYKSEYN
jgi:calcineurin-like phosphoesterase family protein